MKKQHTQDWIFGTHAVLAALENRHRRAKKLLVTAETYAQYKDALDQNQQGLKAEVVALDKIMSAVGSDAVHQGIALNIIPLAETSLEDVVENLQNTNGLLLILDQVTDPHNIGAIMRSAAAFGALGVVCQDKNAPPVTGVMAKAACGAVDMIPLIRVTNIARAIEYIKKHEFWVAGLSEHATQTVAQANLSGRVALVLGAEGDGMRRLVEENCDFLVKLPTSDIMPSLNVSNAAAVALYEVAKSQN